MPIKHNRRRIWPRRRAFVALKNRVRELRNELIAAVDYTGELEQVREILLAKVARLEIEIAVLKSNCRELEM